MTKEQEEAIEICKKKIIEPFYDFPNPTSIELKDTDVEAIETALNILKEKDKEIEKLEKQSKNLDKQAQQYFEQTIYLDKQIDLMAEYIATLDIEEDICANVENDNCDKMNFGECEDCIKKFFERKSEE